MHANCEEEKRLKGEWEGWRWLRGLSMLYIVVREEKVNSAAIFGIHSENYK